MSLDWSKNWREYLKKKKSMHWIYVSSCPCAFQPEMLLFILLSGAVTNTHLVYKNLCGSESVLMMSSWKSDGSFCSIWITPWSVYLETRHLYRFFPLNCLPLKQAISKCQTSVPWLDIDLITTLYMTCWDTCPRGNCEAEQCYFLAFLYLDKGRWMMLLQDLCELTFLLF